MRPRTVLIIAIVVVVLFLGLPMIGYANVKPVERTLKITVNASLASASSMGVYSVSFALDQGGKQSYWSYFGEFWSLGSSLSTVNTFPQVSVVITNGQPTYARLAEDQSWAYTYGTQSTHVITMANHVDPGQKYDVQVGIDSAQSVGNGFQRFTYTVPGV